MTLSVALMMGAATASSQLPLSVGIQRTEIAFTGEVHRVWSTEPERPGDLPLTRALVEVDRTLLGGIDTGWVVVFYPGGPAGDDQWLSVAGAPTIDRGERILVLGKVRPGSQHMVSMVHWDAGLLTEHVDGDQTVARAEGGAIVGSFSPLGLERNPQGALPTFDQVAEQVRSVLQARHGANLSAQLTGVGE